MPTPEASLAAREAQRELCDKILETYLETTCDRYAKGTVRSKRMAVRRFLGWCRVEGIDPLEAGMDDVDRFAGTLDRSLSHLTVREYRCNTRVFLRWLQLRVSVHIIETGGREDARALFV